MMSAEILALEQDLEKERERTARSLEEVQRGLEEAESTNDVSVTRADAPTREKELIAERDRATRALNDALRRLGHVLSAGPDETPADAARAAERSLREHARRLEEEIEALCAKTDKLIQTAIEEARAQIEERVRDQLAQEAGKEAARVEQRLKRRQQELRVEAKREIEREIRRDMDQDVAKKIDEIKRSAESRANQIEVARRDAEEAQRRLDEIAERMEAASGPADRAQSPSAEQKAGPRDQREPDPLDRLEAEVRRLAEESDTSLEQALAKVRGETEARMRQEAESRLREQERTLRAEAEELVREARENAREEAARRTEAEVASLRAQLDEEADAIRADAEVAARTSAAEWLREQTKGIVREPEPKRSEKQKAPPGPQLDINKASFEQLREVGLSVTQATRVIAYRQRRDGFNSIDDLEAVPGFPKKLLADVRDRLTA